MHTRHLFSSEVEEEKVGCNMRWFASRCRLAETITSSSRNYRTSASFFIIGPAFSSRQPLACVDVPEKQMIILRPYKLATMPFKKVINLGPAQAQTTSSYHSSRMSRLCYIARLGNKDDGPTLESSQQFVHALNLKLNPGSKLNLTMIVCVSYHQLRCM